MCDRVQTGRHRPRYKRRSVIDFDALGPAAITAANAKSHFTNHQQESTMNMTLTAGPLISLIAGILILVMPRLLNYIVAVYLIVIGLLGLFGGNINFR